MIVYKLGDLSFKVVRGDCMSKKQVNFNTEWLMFVAGKGKVKLSLLTQPLSISVQVQYSLLRLDCLITHLSSNGIFPSPLLSVYGILV